MTYGQVIDGQILDVQGIDFQGLSSLIANMEVAIGEDVDGRGLYAQAIDGQGVNEQGMHLGKTDGLCIVGQDIDMEIATSQCIDSQFIQAYDRSIEMETADSHVIDMETGGNCDKDNQCISGESIKMEKTDSQVEDGDTTLRCTQKRMKIAMFLAYCGGGFQGMQKNPGAITIEGELEKALIRSGAMPHNYGDNPRRVDWTRAARTDKGVSAVGQIVSGFFYVDPPGFVERVNSHLPKQIRVFGFTRVTPSFGAKKFCDRRRYEYVIPIFALDPTTHRDTEFVVPTEGREEAYSKCLEHCQRGRHIVDGADKQCETLGTEELGTSTDNNVDIPKNVIETVTMHEETNETLVFSSGEQQISSKEVGKDLVQIQSNVGIESTNSLVVEEKVNTFHYGESERTKLNRILNKFVGTHNFHNFTSKMKAEDPSAKRYIVSFEAGNVFTVRETELIRCTVVGQSFVLHQIRKMIGLAIAVFRGCAPESMIDLSLRRLV